MNKKLVGGVVALLAALAAIWLLWFRDRDDEAKPAPPTPTGQVKVEAPAKSTDTPRMPQRAAPQWSIDTDREGPLRMEGQVVGDDNKGIAGAEVWLGSVPPRSTKSEEDGTFSFDKLVGRTYSVWASSDARVGGPIPVKLTAKSDPVVIRMTAGGELAVMVVDDAAKPIADAEVKVGDNGERTAKTDPTGKATLKPIHPGYVTVHASAAGYAPGMALTGVGAARSSGAVKIVLHEGAAVSGRVIDEAGKPLAKVRVSPGDFGDADSDRTTTDDKGQFSFAALAPGSHMLLAVDGEHAPARSTPFHISLRHPITGLEIVMKAGGVLAGTVVDTDGKPAPFATVRVAGAGAQSWRVTPRQATTDQAGAFEIRGLARVKVQARAESDTAASQITNEDLTSQPVHKGVKLVLDVSGTIAGTVVDEGGKPVTEVQVMAYPDLLSSGGATDSLSLAGMSSATTDGAGAFTLHGLPDGAFRLWATRGSANRNGFQQGTQAKTGDKSVRIVLPAPGSLVGKVQLASGSPPALAIVMVSSQTPTPVHDGAISISELAPGNYDVMIRGPEFTDVSRRDVKIESGKTTDLGTITAVRGRRFTGTVVDNTSAPVGGAKVRVGAMLFAQSGQEDRFDNLEDVAGIRSAISDPDGTFTIVGIPTVASNVVADHPDRGRSLAAEIPAGTDDPPATTLALRGFGSIAGKVTMKGAPVGGATVGEASKGGTAQGTFAQTSDDGTYSLTRVPEGVHVLNAIRSQMMSLKSTSVTVTVVAGQQVVANIDIPVGAVTLKVEIKPLAGNKVDAAQVALFKGSVNVDNAKQLSDGIFQSGLMGVKTWLGSAFPGPEFDELVPDAYSICTVPLTGNMADPTLQQRIGQNLSALKVYCKAITVTPTPTAQTITHEVPSMQPLPPS